MKLIEAVTFHFLNTRRIRHANTLGLCRVGQIGNERSGGIARGVEYSQDFHAVVGRERIVE